MSRVSVYQIVTDRIKKKLSEGVVPWRQPWTNNGAVNWQTQKGYRGINVFLLEPGEYATFNQIRKAGGKVKKGEESSIVIFWKWIEKEDEETGEIEKFPMLRYYRVFNVLTQCEGLESRRKQVDYEHDPITEAESIIKGYMGAPDITNKEGQAYYRPFSDVVNVPPIKDFKDPHMYYSVMFHELIHSTGHADRLNRDGVTSVASFGSETYSREELIAEFGAAMLCGVAGIENHTLEMSASYIQSWLRALDDDPKLVVQAAANAQRAADYIRNIKFE